MTHRSIAHCKLMICLPVLVGTLLASAGCQCSHSLHNERGLLGRYRVCNNSKCCASRQAICCCQQATSTEQFLPMQKPQNNGPTLEPSAPAAPQPPRGNGPTARSSDDYFAAVDPGTRSVLDLQGEVPEIPEAPSSLVPTSRTPEIQFAGEPTPQLAPQQPELNPEPSLVAESNDVPRLTSDLPDSNRVPLWQAQITGLDPICRGSLTTEVAEPNRGVCLGVEKGQWGLGLASQQVNTKPIDPPKPLDQPISFRSQPMDDIRILALPPIDFAKERESSVARIILPESAKPAQANQAGTRPAQKIR